MSGPGSAVRAARRLRSPLLLYPVLALLSFPTLPTLLRGTAGWAYALDVFDDGGGLARLAIAVRDWSANGLTLWDPYLTAGNAFLGQFALPPYSPDVALAFLVGPFWAMAIAIWFTAALAGVGMHLFLRDGVGLPPLAVAGGSVMAVLCFWHPIYGVSVAILPLMLWLGDRASAPGPHRRRWAAAAIAGATLALYAGLLQTTLFTAAVHLAWVLWSDRGHRRAGVTTWVATWGIAMGLYAPVLLTQLLLLPISERSVWQLDPGGIWSAIKAVGRHYSVMLAGPPDLRGRAADDPRYGTVFLGGIGLVLALAGVVTGTRRRAALFLVAALFAVPALDWLAIAVKPVYEQLGILRSFQFVRIRHFMPFALSGVVALGIAALGAGGPWTVLKRRLVLVGGALALAAVTLEAGVAGWRAIHHLRIPASPVDAGWPILAAGIVAGLAGGIVLLVSIARHGSLPTGRLLLAVALLFVADRALVPTGTLLVGPNIATYDQRLATTGGQRYLLAQPGIASQRVLTFGDHANRMAFVGLRQADGYQAIYPVAYHGFFGALTAPGLATSPQKWNYFHHWGARAYAFFPQVDPELVSLAGVRWLYVADGSVPTVPGMIERYRDATVTVYENPAAFPRAFVVGGVEAAATTPVVLDRLAAASLDELAGRVFVTGADAAGLGSDLGLAIDPAGGSPAGTPGPDGTATITLDTPDRVEIDATLDRAGVLVLTDVVSPGWVAEVDGRKVPIRTVDAAFRGIALTAGPHHVVLRYGPGFTYLGFGAAGAALLLIPAWLWLVGRRRREAPASDVPGATATADTGA